MRTKQHGIVGKTQEFMTGVCVSDRVVILSQDIVYRTINNQRTEGGPQFGRGNSIYRKFILT